MWVSIAAWVVVVLSSLFRVEYCRWDPNRPSRLTLRVAYGRLLFRFDEFRFDEPGDPHASVELAFSPSAPDWWLLRPSIDRVGTVSMLIFNSRDRWIDLPAWYFAVPPTLAFVVLHRCERRRLAHRVKHNLCTRCGYSRAGIAEGAACPECGGNPANTRT